MGLFCNSCCFLQHNYSHHGQLQATSMMSPNTALTQMLTMALTSHLHHPDLHTKTCLGLTLFLFLNGGRRETVP